MWVVSRFLTKKQVTKPLRKADKTGGKLSLIIGQLLLHLNMLKEYIRPRAQWWLFLRYFFMAASAEYDYFTQMLVFCATITSNLCTCVSLYFGYFKAKLDFLLFTLKHFLKFPMHIHFLSVPQYQQTNKIKPLIMLLCFCYQMQVVCEPFSCVDKSDIHDWL